MSLQWGSKRALVRRVNEQVRVGVRACVVVCASVVMVVEEGGGWKLHAMSYDTCAHPVRGGQPGGRL